MSEYKPFPVKKVSLNPLAQLFAGMKDKKVEKAAKATGGMFKSLMSAVPGVGPVMRLLGSLSSILDVMKPFEVIIKIVSALLSVMSAEIIKPLFMALRPVMDVLMSLTPIFKMLGKIIGVVLQIGLIPLTVIFKLCPIVRLKVGSRVFSSSFKYNCIFVALSITSTKN